MSESISENPLHPKSLTHSSLGHFLWMFGGGSVQAILKILVLMILSRLLTPAEFGLVAAATTIVALAEVFGKIGIAPSIVQARVLTPEHIRTGTTATLVSGVLVGVVVYAIAEPLGRLYAIEALAPLVRVFAFLFVLRALGLVSEALIQRESGFRGLAVITVLSYMIGYAGVAIVLALLGFGVWALVAGQMAQVALQSLLLIHFAGYRLRPGFDYPKFKGMLRFGFGTTLAQIGNYAALNVDYFIVGRVLGVEPLGLYSRAYLLLSQPANLVGNMADKVLFPVLASVQTDFARVMRAYEKTLALTAITQIPLSIYLCVYGQEVVHFLMGRQWGAAVLPFQIMVCSLYFRTAYKFTGTVLRAIGAVYQAALLQWTYAGLVALGAVVGVTFGLTGVAIGTTAAVVIFFFLGQVLLAFRHGLLIGQSFFTLLRHMAVGLVYAILLFGSRQLEEPLGLPPWAGLAIGAGVGVVIYVGLHKFWPRALGPEREAIASLARRFLRR
ncbi:lipopolysaccharide biosynthesis protein [Maritimibacter sp. DP1N21-5]|uniref:lipopolysaccharide biosynthesis protein n=1 Tax=Maritimibacter sp. DP1N21-5 TaxID=2836867 RepID=UPI001C472F65|nr:lipopolysaccharide biosynthesis protein [Maritimibacter sp. DP1N21-5]MBV7410316.1 lipopolysaccharide biosynthesis protein [Maritimibacter sp. DP1N21-5]